MTCVCIAEHLRQKTGANWSANKNNSTDKFWILCKITILYICAARDIQSFAWQHKAITSTYSHQKDHQQQTYTCNEIFFYHENVFANGVFNSLAPGKFEWDLRYLIFRIISVIDGWGICCELALRWMSLDLTDDKSTLVQVMAWCRPATSHYLSQCWPRFLLPYGVTRPQCFNTLAPGKLEWNFS